MAQIKAAAVTKAVPKLGIDLRRYMDRRQVSMLLADGGIWFGFVTLCYALII